MPSEPKGKKPWSLWEEQVGSSSLHLGSNLVRLRGEEIMELGTDRAKVELAHACFSGGCVIWKNIFAKQFAYHQDKPLDPRAEHV